MVGNQTRLCVSGSLNNDAENNLWAQAIAQLDPSDRANINFSYDKLSILSDLEKETQTAQKRCDEKRLCYKHQKRRKSHIPRFVRKGHQMDQFIQANWGRSSVV